MRRDVMLYLHDIWESISIIDDYKQELTEEDFYINRQIQDAIIRRLEIIGEAAKNVGEEIRNKYPDVPWKQVAGMRDVLIHGYFGVKLKRIWEVLKTDIPELKQKIRVIMDKEKDSP